MNDLEVTWGKSVGTGSPGARLAQYKLAYILVHQMGVQPGGSLG